MSTAADRLRVHDRARAEKRLLMQAAALLHFPVCMAAKQLLRLAVEARRSEIKPPPMELLKGGGFLRSARLCAAL